MFAQNLSGSKSGRNSAAGIMTTRDSFHTWQEYQSDLLKSRRKKRTWKNIFPWGKIGILTACFLLAGHWVSFHKEMPKDLSFSSISKKEDTQQPSFRSHMTLELSQVRNIMDKLPLVNRIEPMCSVRVKERTLTIHTSLDPELQVFLTSTLDRLKALNRGKPRQIAMLVMDGQTGQIIAMTGFDTQHPDINPCLPAAYPAASIFKVVTATAVMDAHGYTPHSLLYYNGNKYTLYKRQLRTIRNKYTVKISLANAFAQSVNPVFGKIGKNIVGKQGLMDYATGFGFNHVPASDFSFETGCFDTGKGGYHLAELGCGFNTDTCISPVFGAMIASCVLNEGKMLIPRVVDRILDSKGQILYTRTFRTSPAVMAPATAASLADLMKATVRRGTAKKAFQRASRDNVLYQLELGGKTGSLYNSSHTIKYDWFIGFGRQKKEGKSLALAVVVGHGKYIGTRAAEHARRILRKYFAPYTAHQ